MDDEALVAALERELAHKAQRLELTLEPLSVLQIAGLLQLAARHSGVAPNQRTTIARFLEGARAYFADCPAVLEVLRRGDDPTEDR